MPENRISRGSNLAEVQFLGGTTDEIPVIYILASPTTYVTLDDPPILLVHGELDSVVPLSQSEIIYRAYQQTGLEAKLIKVTGAGHGLKNMTDSPISPSQAEIDQMVLDFFLKHLLDNS